jgi:hypothetical protein
MKKEKLEDLLYPDDQAELMRRIEEGQNADAWSDGVMAFLDKVELDLGGKKAVTTQYDFAEA